MKRFSTLLSIFFAAIVFSPVGYSQFVLPAPGLDVSITVPSDVQNGAFTARMRFTEEVLDFVQSDVILTGTATASITAWASTDDTVFTATITPVTSGTVIISVPTDVATDGGGTQNNAATPQTVRVDVDAPSVGITVPSVAQSGAFEATLTFTESVSDFEQSDLTLSGTATASITAWVSTDDTVFTATITPTTEGDVVLSVAANVATDAASNNNTASETQTVTVDMTSPGVSLSVPEGAQNGAFNVTIIFSEAVSDFEQSDLSVSGTATASITAWQGIYDTVFTATITPTTSGTVILGIAEGVATDAASNNNTASKTQIVNIDMDAPVISITVPIGVQDEAFDVTITFTESVFGFEQADLSVSGTATASITAWATTDNTVFTATISLTASGEVVLSVAADVATDAAGNNNLSSVTVTVKVTVEPETVLVSVCDRTPQVRDAIVAALPNVSDCAKVPAADLATIMRIDIQRENITALKAGDFNGLTALKNLDLSSNDLGSLPAGIFDELTVLEALDLENNSLDSLPDGIFDNLTQLDRLSLESNDLGSLPAGIFDELTDLTRLYLDNNDLGSLPAGIFDELTALKDIDLGGNDLSHLPSSLPSGIFDELTALETLDLSLNDLDSLPDDIFDNLTALETLDLEDNNLDSLPDDIFDNFTALEWLDLSSNDLDSLPDDIFDNLTALETLNLNHNSLDSLPDDIFDSLTALETLDLGFNDLDSLPDGIFNNLTQLEQLSLESNKLSSLPDGIFVGLTSLERLDTEENTVDPLPLTVSLEKVGENQIKAVAPTGAPFNIVFSPTITNGSLENDATTLTISIGSIESDPVTVIQTPGTTDAVTVDISTLPSPPHTWLGEHDGYVLSKSADLPLEVVGAGNGAPALGMTHLIDSEILKSLDPVAVAAELATLRAKSDGSLKYQRAIALLESVLASLRPAETLLLANYPNPFNPETWIPYHLADASTVVITIYDMRGTVVRRLDLGHQREGYYTSRSRAAYWDGRNNRGERVASGIYFYQLEADHTSFLRKMLILK